MVVYAAQKSIDAGNNSAHIVNFVLLWALLDVFKLTNDVIYLFLECKGKMVI